MATDITDEELTAYLDGEADAGLARRIAAALKEDSELAVRLEALDINTGDLKADFEQLLHQAPADLVPSVMPRTRSWFAGSAIAASLVLGLGMGYLLFKQPTPSQRGWMEYVAAYQALYVSETLLSADAADLSELANLSAVIGRPLALASQAPGLTYRRGQVLGFQDKPLIQLAYLAGDDVPIALCIIRNGTAESAIEISDMEGMKAASWSDGAFTYLLIGGADATLIERSAAHFQTNL